LFAGADLNSRGLGRLLVIVRVAKKLGKSWVARHEKDGLDEWKIATFVRSQYMLGSFERTEPDIAMFRFRFRKGGGHLVQATLWARERKQDGISELVIYKGHVEPVES